MGYATGDPIESPAERAGIVRASVDIAASPEEVFRALVEPHELAAWLGGEPMPADPRDEPPDHRTMPQPGAAWRAPAIAPDGTNGTVAGEYLHVLPPHALETTWRASWNDFTPERVGFQLVPVDVGGIAGTRVTVTHTRAESRLATVSGAHAATTARGDAWPIVLARLAAHVATTRALAHWAGHHAASADAFGALHRAVVDLHAAK